MFGRHQTEPFRFVNDSRGNGVDPLRQLTDSQGDSDVPLASEHLCCTILAPCRHLRLVRLGRVQGRMASAVVRFDWTWYVIGARMTCLFFENRFEPQSLSLQLRHKCVAMGTVIDDGPHTVELL